MVISINRRLFVCFIVFLTCYLAECEQSQRSHPRIKRQVIPASNMPFSAVSYDRNTNRSKQDRFTASVGEYPDELQTRSGIIAPQALLQVQQDDWFNTPLNSHSSVPIGLGQGFGGLNPAISGLNTFNLNGINGLRPGLGPGVSFSNNPPWFNEPLNAAIPSQVVGGLGSYRGVDALSDVGGYQGGSFVPGIGSTYRPYGGPVGQGNVYGLTTPFYQSSTTGLGTYGTSWHGEYHPSYPGPLNSNGLFAGGYGGIGGYSHLYPYQTRLFNGLSLGVSPGNLGSGLLYSNLNHGYGVNYLNNGLGHIHNHLKAKAKKK